MPEAKDLHRSRLEMFLLAAAIWAMCLVTFSLPGREAPNQSVGLDIIALAKLAVRAGVLLLFLLMWRQHAEPTSKRYVFWCYFPFLCYVIWAFVSATWSPLKAVSIGQAMGLAALVALSAWIAMSCREHAQALFIAKQVWNVLLVYSLFLVTVHLIRPDMSGLSRDLQLRGSNGLINPTYAGATAGLGFLFALLAPKLIRGFETRIPLIVALGVHGALLFFSNSRTSLACTLAVAFIGFLRFYPKKLHATFLLAGTAAACLYLVVDPGFTLHKENLSSSTEYITRGQSQQQLTGLSGRMEMWQAVWEQFEKSPMIGHGYFVTSENGRLDVWNGPSNHTAHNLALQVLVSTGLIGGLIFFIAFWRVGSVVRQLRWKDASANGLLFLILLFGLWYLGWCQTCISFIGPVLPESVLFFLLIGLGIGQVVPTNNTLTPYNESLASA